MSRVADPRTRRPLYALLLAAALALTACSSDDGGDDGATSEAADRTEAEAEGTDPLPPLPDDVALPIVFVHGFAGSAQQYESQAMRFVANGYPQERIVAYDHDGAGLDIAAYVAGPDRGGRRRPSPSFDVEQVYLVGHSRGTSVSTHLTSSDPAQAAKVAKYVAIDGRPCPDASCPASRPPRRQFPGQSHVEVATSKESFAMQYEFLVGEAPEVVDIVAAARAGGDLGPGGQLPRQHRARGHARRSGRSTPTPAPAPATSRTPPSSSAPTASSARSSSRPAPTTSTPSPPTRRR